MLQRDSGMTVSSNRQTLGILLVWHLHSLHESVDQGEQVVSVRQRGMETITASEYSECNSRRIWNDNVGIEFTHFYLTFTVEGNRDCILCASPLSTVVIRVDIHLVRVAFFAYRTRFRVPWRTRPGVEFGVFATS